MADASVLTVEELKGPQLRPARVVELMGPALPFRGAPWAGRMRLTTTWYPGNAVEATQHVLGPVELPSTWEGEWRTTRMVHAPSTFQDLSGSGEISQITQAHTMRDVLEDMFRAGALLRVTWAQGERRVTRLGRAEEWEWAHDRADDIAWRVSWAWVGRGGAQQRVVVLRQEQPAVSAAQAAQIVSELVALADLAEIAAVDRTTTGTASQLTLGDLEALLEAPVAFIDQFKRVADQLVNRFSRIANLVLGVVALPDTLLASLVDAGTNAVNAFNQVVDDASRLPAELQAGRDNRLAAMLRATNYFNSVQGAGQTAAELAQRVAAEARKRLSQAAAQGQQSQAGPADMQAVHVVKAGETFASISQLFYGTPDQGPQVAKANGFPPYQVAPPAGFVLVIPNLAATGTGVV